jgi:predicted Zn-dependent protease with MMP-like domain
MLCTIDSGANAGASLWHGTELVFCRLVREREIRDWQRQVLTLFDQEVTNTVVEIPIVRKNQGTKVDPNGLIKLGVSAGRLIPAFGGEVSYLYPNQWKGTLPDEVLYRRILSALSEKEKALLPKLAAGLIHNVLDSVGIGLDKLGRMPKTLSEL